MPTLTIGSHGEMVIPKPMREELGLKKGSKIDVHCENSVIMVTPSIEARTKLDDDFDRVRASYLANGVTLDDMMATLREIYENNE